MSSSNEMSDPETSKFTMKPAVSKIFCCSVTAASGFIAAYALVAYAIALIYEIVWVVEAQSGLPVPSALLMICYCVVIAATVTLVHGLISVYYEIVWVVEAQSGLPVPSALLMICYCVVIAATVTLVHGLITKNNRYLLAWLVTVILVLIPECALVFYMSISYWGLQGVYGGAELACYVARLPAIVIGVVLVQSAYALREARKGGYGNGAGVSGSEFDASHYVPDTPSAFTNDGFLADNGKPGSMPDLRRHLAARQSINLGYPPMVLPQPPPAYWQHLAERQYAASLRGYPKPYSGISGPQMYGTWVGPRSGPYNDNYKRRHSVVGAFDEYPAKLYDYDDRMDCKSEMAYPYYRSQQYYDPRMYPDYDPRYYEYKREEAAYGVNLLRHDPYHHYGSRERVFYGLRNSHTSMGNESDDLTKYKDVAL